MQMLSPMLLQATAQFVAQLFAALRTRKKSIDKRAKIESRAPPDDGEPLSLLTFARDLSRLTGIFSGAAVGKRIDAIEQMMRNLRALRGTGLGRADFEFAVHRYRIAVDDFSRETPRDCQRQRRFAASRGTKHNYDERPRPDAKGVP